MGAQPPRATPDARPAQARRQGDLFAGRAEPSVPQVATAVDLGRAFGSLPAGWRAVLPGWTSARETAVAEAVRRVSGERPIAPPDPFRALRLVSPGAVRVVVLGQDPYPTAGHADGLAFSAGRGKPRSLARIFEVLARDRPGFSPPPNWTLDGWARQGVLLLNPVLTVEVGRAGSHESCGWQALTAEIVSVLARRSAPPVFLLWGARAQAFFEAALPAGCAPHALRTRHPSYDFERRFMAPPDSHFLATCHLVDWWRFEGR
jgi:uracil-DNA glycosylase